MDEMQARKKLLSDAVACLKAGYKIEQIGEANGSVILQGGFPGYPWISLCDNGGEFNVEKINDSDSLRSVPYTWFGELLDGGTMAYRIYAAMRGAEIDWNWRDDFLLEYAGIKQMETPGNKEESMATAKYFSGTTELSGVHPLKNERFLAIGGVKSKHNRYDDFSRMVGHPKEGPDAILPVTRTIFYSSRPSLHKCDSRCRSAKGHNCECACGGQFHGAGA